MNCERFEKLVDPYLDGQLHGTLLAEFHAHRLNCRRCSRAVSMLQAAADVIAQDRCEPKIGLDFADRVLAAMPMAHKANRSIWLVRLTAGAASVAAAAAIALGVLLSGQNQAKPPRVAGEVAISVDPGTLLDGKVVKDAVNGAFSWYETEREGQ